jgi:hypothetical protein
LRLFQYGRKGSGIVAIMVDSYFILSFDVEYIILDGTSSLGQHTCLFFCLLRLSGMTKEAQYYLTTLGLE